MNELIKLLKEIQQGIEGQVIPYNITVNALRPIVKKNCLEEVIYLIENWERFMAEEKHNTDNNDPVEETSSEVHYTLQVMEDKKVEFEPMPTSLLGIQSIAGRGVYRDYNMSWDWDGNDIEMVHIFIAHTLNSKDVLDALQPVLKRSKNIEGLKKVFGKEYYIK